MSYTEFDAIQIGIASPRADPRVVLRRGQKPETINYRTLKPERDGLFCERIFGPTKDWECHCGKYKKIRYKGKICDRCGVEVTGPRCAGSAWATSSWPPRSPTSGTLRVSPPGWACCWTSAPASWRRCCISPPISSLIPATSPLAKNQILSEKEYRDMREKYEDDFDAGMGAEAVKSCSSRSTWRPCPPSSTRS